jgi:hypothetical protein
MLRKNIQDKILSAETEVFVGYDFHSGVTMKNIIFWKMASWYLVDICRQHGETYSVTVMPLLYE